MKVLPLILLLLPALPSRAQEALGAILEKIEATRRAPYTERLPWYRKLTGLESSESRRASLRLLDREDHPGLEGLLLAHVAPLPGQDELMLEHLEKGRSLGNRVIAARYFAERRGREGRELLEALLDESPAILLHSAILQALARHPGEEARRIFLDRFFREPYSTRLSVLRSLRGLEGPHMDRVRRDCAKETYPLLALEALEQIVRAGDEEALKRVRRMARGRVEPMKAPMLFRILALRPTERDLFLLAKLYDEQNARLQSTARTTLPRLAGMEVVRSWATGRAVSDLRTSVHRFAVRILELMDGTRVRNALLALLEGRDEGVRRRSKLRLAALGDERIVPMLEKDLETGRDLLRMDALESLNRVLSEDRVFLDRLLGFARNGKGDFRLLALDLAARHGMRGVLGEIPTLLRNPDWRFKSAGVFIARRIRDRESIPLLIRFMKRETGRLEHEAREALASLTRLYFQRSEAWERWWKDEGADFVLPPPPEESEKIRPEGGQGAGATMASFYGIPIVSMRTVYVLDVSGSMAGKVGTGGLTRLQVAQRSLKNALDKADKRTLVNIVFFDTNIHPYAKKMTSLKKRGELSRLKDFVDKARPLGATNIHGALLEALADPRVDTVYLLSDGTPSAGEIQDPKALGDDILRRNRTRRIILHCISIGLDSPLLRRLAGETGGKYVRY